MLLDWNGTGTQSSSFNSKIEFPSRFGLDDAFAGIPLETILSIGIFFIELGLEQVLWSTCFMPLYVH